MLEDKIIKLKEKINNRLLKMRDNFSHKTDDKGKNRHEKGEAVVEVFSYIINEAIKNTKSKVKLYTSEVNLPQKEKKLLLRIDVSEKYIKEFNLNFDDKEKEEGYKCSYDGFLVSDKKIEMFLEFKAYTEVTMWKRCLIDASLIKNVYPKDSSYTICMLESQIGSTRKKKVLKDISYSAHSQISYMQSLDLIPPIYLNILMDGQRNPKKNIANPKFFKYANPEKIEKTYNFFLNFFETH